MLMEKLIGLNMSPLLVLWICEFLVGRVQYVKLKEQISVVIVTNTGAPQGCVLSPLLFSLYTNDCRSRNDCNKIFKYADDTAIVSLCVNNDVMYRQKVNSFSTWCKENFLKLNVNVNDLYSGISSDISKFADNTKVGRKIQSQQDVNALQEDLNRMYEWFEN